MRTFIYSLALICTLSAGDLVYAQGRGTGGGGRPEGLPDAATRTDRPASSNANGGNRQNTGSDHNANATSDSKKALGTQDASVQLAHNSGLSTQIAKLFPMGTDLGSMASGFKTLGGFVAAAHAANNMQIPFDQLKTKIVTDGSSLGDAIHSLKPELTQSAVKTETKKAEDQAKKDTSGKV